MAHIIKKDNGVVNSGDVGELRQLHGIDIEMELVDILKDEIDVELKEMSNE